MDIPGSAARAKDKALSAKIKGSLNLKCSLFLGVVAFFLYANTLQNNYAYDDYMVINESALVKAGVFAIPEILITPYHYGIVKERNRTITDDIYRPLSIAMFAIEYQIFQDNPMPGHLINVLIYSFCCILFFLFLLLLFKQKRPFVAFAGALFFTLHPIHTEVVANIKSRDELLCFLFGFLSLIAMIKYQDTGKKISLLSGLILFFLSLLSKETSITFLLIIPLIFLFYRNENKSRSLWICLFSFLPALLFMFIRYAVLNQHQSNYSSESQFVNNALIAAPTIASRLATEILVMGYYLRLLVIPYPLICDYGYNSIPYVYFDNVTVWISILVYGLLLFFGIYRLVKKKCDPLAFGIMLFSVTIALFSNIFFLIASELSERFLFFPSAGFALIIAWLIAQILFRNETVEINRKTIRRSLFVFVPVSLIFTWITVERNSEWKDNNTLFRADSKKSPDNFKLYWFVGDQDVLLSKEEGTDAATRKQLLDDAINNYQKSIAIYPDFALSQKSLAQAFISTKQMDSAEVHCKSAIIYNPNDTGLLVSLANIYAGQRKYPEAAKLLKKISTISPNNPYFLYNVAASEMYSKQYDTAIIYLKKSLALNPVFDKAIKLISVLYNVAGQTDSAKKYEAEMQKIEPGFRVENVVLPR